MRRAAFTFLGAYRRLEGDENNKQVLTNLIEPDARSRKKALKGPKPMKYMDADGSHVKERPSNTTGTARDWLEISSSDDDSDSEPQTGIPLDPPAPPAARRAPTVRL